MSLLVATCCVLALPFMHATAAGDVIYTTTGPGTGFATVDSTTAASAFLGPTGYTNTFAAALDLDGTLWTIINGFSTAQIATVDKTTGVATPAPNPIGTQMISLEIGGDGTMYGIGYNDGVLYRIDKATGVGTVIGDTGIVTPMDLAFDCDGRLWATAMGDVWTVDTTTGAATAQPSITGVSEGPAMVMGLFFDNSCQMLVTTYTNPGTLYAVDASGAATAIGSTGLNQPHGGSIKAFPSKTVAPTDTQAPSTEAPKAPSPGQVLTSRRRETIHFAARYRGHPVRAIKASVVGGRKLEVKRSRGKYKILVNLRGFACGSVKVKIKIVRRGAPAVNLQRVFRTCVPRAGS